MKIGVPKEIKDHEYRVGLTPSMARELVARGHQVLVQSEAGEGIGMTDAQYKAVGAQIVGSAEGIFESAEMIVKVKEPQPEECQRLSRGQILFTYLHLAPDPEQASLLKASNCTAVAYETVTDENGHLPLLTPMSEIAGRMAIQAGANCLEKNQGGRGVLLGGVPGVLPGRVLIVGGGVVGTQSIRMALGIEAEVTVVERSISRMRELKSQFGSKLKTLYSTTEAIEEEISKADLVVGAVLIPGASAPKVLTRSLIQKMQPGSVFVDVAIDQGGCSETSRPTTYSSPTYIEEEVVHYCVTNMPGAVPRTSAIALNNATFPYISLIADRGLKQACEENRNLLSGVNVHDGKFTHLAVAKAFNETFHAPENVL